MSDATEPRIRPSVPEFDRPDRGAPAREPLWRELVGDELRARRRERGETLVETARKAGVSPQYLSEMERGTKDPSSEMIAAVSGALGLSLLELTSTISESLETRAVMVSARSVFALAA